MSFADSLTRLRAAGENRQRGKEVGRADVKQADILELLRHFDRLDGEERHEHQLKTLIERLAGEKGEAWAAVWKAHARAAVLEAALRAGVAGCRLKGWDALANEMEIALSGDGSAVLAVVEAARALQKQGAGSFALEKALEALDNMEKRDG